MDVLEPIIESSYISEDFIQFLDQVESGELHFVLGKRKRDSDESSSFDEQPAKVQKCTEVYCSPEESNKEESLSEYSQSEDVVYDSDSTPNEQHGYQTLDHTVSQFDFAPVAIPIPNPLPTEPHKMSRFRKQTKIVDLGKYFRLTQLDAAAQIGISATKLASVWKTIPDRPSEQWPYTSLKQIEFRVNCIIQQFAYQQRQAEMEIVTLELLLKKADPTLALEVQHKIKQIRIQYAAEAARLSMEYTELKVKRDMFTKPFVVPVECKIVP